MNDVVTDKVRFTFKNHPLGCAEEFIVATAVGDNIYQIKGAPLFAFGVNYDDHVLVAPDTEGSLDAIDIVARSEYHSLRVCFTNELENAKNIELLQELTLSGVESEQFDDGCFALTVSPQREYESFIDILHYYQELGVLKYELAGEPHDSFDGNSA
ncbi:DUF4265 domain-containing protein [Pseudoalteromonas piscicida]|uniref:DUF4265 domain-containing protein n=1 Tax=Pseudoalteromonas piscicida TaxID=43662 RepID=UPI00273927C5|nr:DUF4265 domain-containing protein [Pseudoalteromonas piscicida]MDP4487630.1 DUF4265 domain-containing protein [Pseudoalteromonas piscicida]